MSEWIKTSDRKPEHSQAVLGTDRAGYVTRYEYDATDFFAFQIYKKNRHG